MGERMPLLVSETGEMIAPGQLRLLMADRDFAGVELFYQGRNIYCFDPADRNLHLFFTRSTDADFIRIDKGLYKDDRAVYFAATERDWGKDGHMRGAMSLFQPIPGILPESFVKVREVEGADHLKGEIYQANDRLFFHRRIVTNIAEYSDALQEIASGAAQPIARKDKYAVYRSVDPDAFDETAWSAASLGAFALAAIASFAMIRRRRRARKENAKAALHSNKIVIPGMAGSENARIAPPQPDKQKWPFA